MGNKSAKQLEEEFRQHMAAWHQKGWLTATHDEMTLEVLPPSKPWRQSKSLLIAGITIALAGLGAYQQGGDPISIAIVVLGALSAAVRTVTSTRLTK